MGALLLNAIKILKAPVALDHDSALKLILTAHIFKTIIHSMGHLADQRNLALNFYFVIFYLYVRLMLI